MCHDGPTILQSRVRQTRVGERTRSCEGRAPVRRGVAGMRDARAYQFTRAERTCADLAWPSPHARKKLQCGRRARNGLSRVLRGARYGVGGSGEHTFSAFWL